MVPGLAIVWGSGQGDVFKHVIIKVKVFYTFICSISLSLNTHNMQCLIIKLIPQKLVLPVAVLVILVIFLIRSFGEHDTD